MSVDRLRALNAEQYMVCMSDCAGGVATILLTKKGGEVPIYALP